MIHLAVSSGGQCLFKKTSVGWVSSGLRICRGTCIGRPPPKTAILRSSTVAVPFLPQRWLNKDALPMRGFSPKYKRDKVPDNFALIYRKYTSDKLMLLFYSVSVAFGFLSGSLYFLAVKTMDYDNTKLIEIPKTGLAVKAYMLHYGAIATMVLSWPFMVHLKFLRHHIIRVYYNKDTDVFIGIMKNRFRKKKVEFTMKDVEPVLDRATRRDRNIIIKGKGYLLFESDFTDLRYINHLMKYS